MHLAAITHHQLAEMFGADDDIDCECMLCHLPVGAKHGPVKWRLTWTWPGPYPTPGTDAILMCDPCYHDWIDHPDSFGGRPISAHRI